MNLLTATRLQELRKMNGYSQEVLAEKLGVSRQSISKWERGVSYPDITLIPDICKYLDVNEHELIESSKDENYHKMKKEAKIYSNIKNAIFYVSSISYLIAILVCFIVLWHDCQFLFFSLPSVR